ncbi:MAG: hypothetical protein Q9170_004828 [Blastenia crenularia]
MFFVYLAFSSWFCSLVSADVTAAVSEDGITRIYGNSFGIPGTDATYDYVIIGGGTAGNTVAARLSQDPANYSVAVIEAGSFYEILNGNHSQVPGYSYTSALSSSFAPRSSVEWIISTTPQAGYNDRKIDYIIGQAFGGSSAANYMGYFRPTAGSLDRWAELVGDRDWSWDSVYPYYKKSCNFTPPNYEKVSPSANISFDPDAFVPNAGPLQVSYGNYQYSYGTPYSRGLESLGFSSLDGINSGKLIGYTAATVSVDPRTATRSSSETSFLQSAARNTGIQIYPNALAKSILFDADKRATGVVVQAASSLQNFNYTLSANKEVIVSAGAWFSPQLLMVSGVGPAATLQEHGIPVVVDLPGVGQNEWDQPWMALSFKVNTLTGTQIAANNVEYLEEVVEQYIRNQSGPLSTIGGGEATGMILLSDFSILAINDAFLAAFEKYPAKLRKDFSNSTRAFLETFPSDWPEAEYLPLAYAPFPDDISSTDNYLLIGSALLSTSSRGNMTIRSADTLDPPIISPNWLLDKGDQEQAIAALLRIREIAAASGIVESEYQPGANVSTRADILEWLRNNMNLIYHAASTCGSYLQSASFILPLKCIG